MNYSFDGPHCQNFEVSSRHEWMLANGIGGYAMGTVSGANTRRYHGHLVAAIEPPADRMVLLANVDAFVEYEGNLIGISCNQYQGTIYPEGYAYLHSFTVSGDQATWDYRIGAIELRKAIRIHQDENAATITYQNIGDVAFALALRPVVCHKRYHCNFRFDESYPQVLAFPPDRTIIEHEGIELVLLHPRAARVPSAGWYYRFEYMREQDRGFDARDDLFCPGELRYSLAQGQSATLVATTKDSVAPLPVVEHDQTTPSLTQGLREAAERFFVTTESRASIIAGYPWFADWGRDTMICIPGLCLHTGRIELAKRIVRDYASHIKEGLIPNRFVESSHEPEEYNTADATLWFANAIHRILEFEWDLAFASEAQSWLDEVFEWHQKGTMHGICVDPKDGLLAQGAVGVQLTWMDAKVDDWIVTPRHGKPIEINGLWINALGVMANIAERLGNDASRFITARDLAQENFERTFWRDSLGYYLDTADPDDASLRPNQVIALSLPLFRVHEAHGRSALQIVRQELLTEFGLRTLSPREPVYRGRFKGPLQELDAAYHQGTVWPWLLGPYVTAMVRLTGDKKEAKQILGAAKTMLWDVGLGGISEVYDGDEPRSAGGCPWQAWSVAEVLRAWIEDAGGK